MNFEKVMKHIFDAEGGFVNHPDDSGKATNFGITIGTLSSFLGVPASVEDVKNLSKEDASLIYKKNYWDKMNLDLLKSFDEQLVLMDQGVNFGPRVAVTRAQEVLRQQWKYKLTVDGDLGKITAGFINNLPFGDFPMEFVQASRLHYVDIVKRKPSQIVFLTGWINRTHRLDDICFHSQTTGTDPVIVSKPDETPVLSIKDPYLWAMKEMETGVKEISGSKHNPRIVYYHSFTTLKATDDETPWCSSFLVCAFESCGLDSTHSAAAKSWLKHKGSKTVSNEEAKPGDLAIFGRAGGGHVAFLHKKFNEGDKHVVVLGGNQSNSVRVSNYPAENLIEFRRITS